MTKQVNVWLGIAVALGFSVLTYKVGLQSGRVESVAVSKVAKGHGGLGAYRDCQSKQMDAPAGADLDTSIQFSLLHAGDVGDCMEEVARAEAEFELNVWSARRKVTAPPKTKAEEDKEFEAAMRFIEQAARGGAARHMRPDARGHNAGNG